MYVILASTNNSSSSNNNNNNNNNNNKNTPYEEKTAFLLLSKLISLVQTLMLHIILILSYEIMHWVMLWIWKVLNKQSDKCYNKVRHCNADQSIVTTNAIILGTALPIIIVEPTVKIQAPVFIISWVLTATVTLFTIQKNNKKILILQLIQSHYHLCIKSMHCHMS